MRFDEAFKIMKQGSKVKIPSWGGYWFWSKEKQTIIMHTKDGEELKKRRRKMKCSKDAFWKCLKWYISKTIIVLTILFLFILLQISGGKEMMPMLWS